MSAGISMEQKGDSWTVTLTLSSNDIRTTLSFTGLSSDEAAQLISLLAGTTISTSRQEENMRDGKSKKE